NHRKKYTRRRFDIYALAAGNRINCGTTNCGTTNCGTTNCGTTNCGTKLRDQTSGPNFGTKLRDETATLRNETSDTTAEPPILFASPTFRSFVPKSCPEVWSRSFVPQFRPAVSRSAVLRLTWRIRPHVTKTV